MFSWFAANLSTILIALILLVLVFFAGRKVFRNKGGCSCGHCRDCGHCSLDTDKEKEE